VACLISVAVVVLSALGLQDPSLRAALEAVAASDTDGLIRLEALLSLVSSGVCNVTLARMLAVLLPQLNLRASIWASKHGIFDAIRVLPCVPELVRAVAAICSNSGASARLQELLLTAVHLSCVTTDEDAIALTKMMVDDCDLAQLCVQPLWRYMVKYIQEAQRMLPHEMVDLLRSASGSVALHIALHMNQVNVSSVLRWSTIKGAFFAPVASEVAFFVLREKNAAYHSRICRRVLKLHFCCMRQCGRGLLLGSTKILNDFDLLWLMNAVCFAPSQFLRFRQHQVA
jgi:hypothetical protein